MVLSLLGFGGVVRMQTLHANVRNAESGANWRDFFKQKIA